jgi:mono/diheme cytochrome c family protein
MKKFFKVLLYIVAAIIIIFVGVITYVTNFLPNVGKPENITVERTAQRIERGKYLANCVTVCMDCHSHRDWTKFAGPMVQGTEGQGGERFDQRYGFPGVFYSRNITPYKLSDWTDGEIFRTITTGVDKNGDALFPVMPYHYYGQLDREDIYSIIAYIRSLPSIKNDVPKSKADFPFSIIQHLIPQKANLQTRPPESDTLAYGKYMITASGCVECHTKDNKGQIIAGLEFGGGREFALPGGTIRSANLTPDVNGLKAWTAEQFIKRFKQYQDTSFHSPTLGEKDYNTVMPWMMYSNMKESDLNAIFKYLQTVKPIANKIEKFTLKN